MIAEKSQQSDDDDFRQRKISSMDADLGSRSILENEDSLIWYPAEVNTSIRPGWFWHENENDKVRPLEELIHIYNNSVGGNATFLLNIPPTKEGLFHENDVKRLSELGEYLKSAFSCNLLDNAQLTADSRSDIVSNIRTDDYDSCYYPEKGITAASVTAEWNSPVSIGNIIVKENILWGQRAESFSLDIFADGEFKEIFSGTVIGYKRIIPLGLVKTDRIRLRITDSRTEPTIAFLGVYRSIK